MALLLPQSHQSCMREEIVGPPVLVGDIRDLGKHPRTFQLETPGCGFPVWGLCEPPPSVPGCLRSQIQTALTVADACPPVTGASFGDGISTRVEI